MTASAPNPPASRRLTYAGVFVLALSTLLLEVLLTRITSVVAWYHLAFFVISLAMLGMTAGAVLVFVRPGWFDERAIAARLAQSAFGYAVSIPLCIALALALPLTPVSDFMSFVGLLGMGALLSGPFVLGGVALTLALTRAGLPPSIAYGVDLLGAASGCALVIPVLYVIDAPSAAIFAAALAALAAALFARAAGRRMRAALALALGLLVVCALNARAERPPLRPAWVKSAREEVDKFAFMGWNTYSRVTVGETMHESPVFWALGNKAPETVLAPIDQRVIKIDGAAGTVMARLGEGPAAHGYLDWDLTSLVHTLRPSGPAAVIGVGGGRDVLSAVRAGHAPVVGIELNELIVDVLGRRMGDFAGIAALPQVELVNDEARSYLTHDRRSYQTIVMSLIDTWATTGTGAYSLSENGLYTVEAFTTFLRRLSRDGLFAVSRWYLEESPGETARMIALAMATSWKTGASTPRDHIVVLRSQLVATLLLGRRPFSAADLDTLTRVANERGYHVLATPRMLPEQPLLRELLSQPSPEALARFASAQVLDVSPPTDARPFFFNMLRPRDWLMDPAAVDALDLRFLGNLQATQTLLYAVLVSLLLTTATLLVPLASRARDLARLPRADVVAALAYFALIGLGFMFVEMGLLSRLNVFLGHPTLALAVLLGGIILFTGVGSLLSSRIDLDRALWARGYPLLPVATTLAVALAALPVLRAFQTASTPVRVLVSLALLLLPALGMGLCFPLGLRLCERMERAHGVAVPRLGPWLWGVNGACGVCASGLALATSMVWGVSATLLIGAGCYVLLLIATVRLARH